MKSADVRVNQTVVGKIGPGLLVFVGVGDSDTERIASLMVEKLLNLRIFSDPAGKMNLSIVQSASGEPKRGLLLISQFTLYGDCRKGRRPSFEHAATPERARELYEFVVATARKSGIGVETGVFREHMAVELVNDGPITLMLDSDQLFPRQ